MVETAHFGENIGLALEKMRDVSDDIAIFGKIFAHYDLYQSSTLQNFTEELLSIRKNLDHFKYNIVVKLEGSFNACFEEDKG